MRCRQLSFPRSSSVFSSEIPFTCHYKPSITQQQVYVTVGAQKFPSETRKPEMQAFLARESPFTAPEVQRSNLTSDWRLSQ